MRLLLLISSTKDVSFATKKLRAIIKFSTLDVFESLGRCRLFINWIHGELALVSLFILEPLLFFKLFSFPLFFLDSLLINWLGWLIRQDNGRRRKILSFEIFPIFFKTLLKFRQNIFFAQRFSPNFVRTSEVRKVKFAGIAGN